MNSTENIRQSITATSLSILANNNDIPETNLDTSQLMNNKASNAASKSEEEPASASLLEHHRVSSTPALIKKVCCANMFFYSHLDLLNSLGMWIKFKQYL